jgi:phosphoglycerate kinase
MKRTVREVDVSEKRVLLRVDFNVPVENGQIIDDSRIRAALPTIQYLIDQRARVILLSHLGRPDGFVVEKLRLNPVADRLADLLRMPVYKVNNSIGPEVHDAVKRLAPGQVLLLENVRFHAGELVNDPHLAARLASFADLFVNDAFATAHRTHASTVAIAGFLPAVAGLLMQSELEGLNRIKGAMNAPVAVILGGTHLIDKIRFIDYALGNGALLMLGGTLANTMLRAQGVETGQSVVETEVIGLARELLADAGDRLLLPVDAVIADSISPTARTRTVPISKIPPYTSIVDIGPRTITRYNRILETARTVIWNGPLGISEIAAFSTGSFAIAEKIAGLNSATTIIGGGETIAAMMQSHADRPVDYLSTGGAAFLHALQGGSLPAIDLLEEKIHADASRSHQSRIRTD